MTQIDNFVKQFKAMGKSIQAVVVLGVVFLLYFAVDSLLIQPAINEYELMQKETEKTIENRKKLEKEVQLLSKEMKAATDFVSDKQLQALKEELIQLEKRITNASGQFVEAKKMSGFLNDLLKTGKKLELLSVEKLPLEFMMLKTINAEIESSSPSNADNGLLISEEKVFRHGVKIKFSGSYREILKYMQAVEQLPWRIFWQSSELVTSQYPKSIVSFELYTLSRDENWLTL